MRRHLIVVGLITSFAACDGRSPSGPFAPMAPAAEASTSLSGQVFEVTATGRVPVAGIEVLAVHLPPGGLGAFTYLTTTSGAEGRYSFAALPPGSAVVRTLSPALRQICGALPALTADTRQDLEVTSTANPQRSAAPAPVRVSGQIYEMTPAGRVGLGGAVIHIDWANDGYFLTVVADADGHYLACGIPANRPLAYEPFRDITSGYNGPWETPRHWLQFSADATFDFELKRRQ